MTTTAVRSNRRVKSVEGSYGKVTFSVEVVTPHVATEMLTHNRNNRRLVETMVEKLAGALERGEWEFNAETIKFDEDGTLIDGQHRLGAIARAGVPAPVLVVRGLSPVARETVDIGRTRRLADHLALRGVMNYTQVAGTTTLLYRVLHNHIPRKRGHYPTHSQLLAFYEEHLTLITDATIYGRAVYQAHLRVAPSILSTAHSLGQIAAPHGQYEEFFNALADGSNLEANSPVLRLRDRLQRDALDRRVVRYQEKQLAAIIKAWNRWVSGLDAPQVYTWRDNEPFPSVLRYDEPSSVIEYFTEEDAEKVGS